VLTRLRKDQSGAALVEFALVAPLLFVLLFGIIDFGKALNYWIDETHLASSGARWAEVNKNPGAAAGQSLLQYIKAQADANELRNGGASVTGTGATVCISYPSGSAIVGQPVQISVTSTYRWLSIVGLPVAATDLNGTATMRLEAVPTNIPASDTCFSGAVS
jgi:Flp pilus assembly protein TadG